MLIVEFSVDSPILEETLARQPDAVVRHEEIYQDDGEISYIFWAESEDLGEFDAALDADPTVTNRQILTEANTRRLYRVTFTDAGDEVATFPAWSELGIVVLDSELTHEGWRVRMRVPDREALAAYRNFCRERGISFGLRSVYDDTGEAVPSSPGTSASQREALTTAYQMGYFEIPRRASLAEVADRLAVSQQAVSERIRRGTATLVESNFPRDV